MSARYLCVFTLPFVAACGSTESAPAPHGLKLTIAPLELTSIDVACYDILVAGQGLTIPAHPPFPAIETSEPVWSMGTQGVSAAEGDDALCSDQYGNGAGGGIAYVGTCDASEDADTDPDQPGVQNAVTIWFDGLYTGSSDAGLTPLPTVTTTTNGTCTLLVPSAGFGSDEILVCEFADGLPFGVGARIPCSDDSACVVTYEAPTWQDPCGSEGCTLEFDCNANQDTRVQFDFTVMRDAKQGFFDVVVNFQDVFCSAKYDTCYDVGGEDEEPINLLFGPDGKPEHTGVMGFACSGNPNQADLTVLHRSEIWVWCDDWNTYFNVDPTQGPGNVETTEEGYVAPTPEELAQCEQACADIRDASLAAQCYADCRRTGYTLRYATYSGTEQLDCGAGPGSCNKVYWNVAFDLAHLQEQGLDNCFMVSIATASTVADTTIVDGEIMSEGTTYPVVDFGNMDGDWETGLPLTGNGTIPCVAEGLNQPGSLVHTEYANNGTVSADDLADYDGAFLNTFNTWMCFNMTQAGSPAANLACLTRYCSDWDHGPYCDDL